MAIPKNLEEVGFNSAVVKMDVDALTRESMIRLFSLTDDSGGKLGDYDELYEEKAKTNTGLNPEESGAASLVKQFVFLEGKILGFLFQQFLSMVKPIQTALELPAILADPPALVRKIKEIIDGIKDLIEDVISFFTETLNWFLSLLLGEIMDINIPIPPMEFSILGITIPIPAIDNLNKTGKEPFIENNTDKALKLKKEIAGFREQMKNLVDKINPDINAYQYGLLALLAQQLIKLLAVDQQLTSEFYDKAYQIHNEIILEKDRIMRSVLERRKRSIALTYSSTSKSLKYQLATKKISLTVYNYRLKKLRLKTIADGKLNIKYYKFVNKTNDMKKFKSYLDNNVKKVNYLNVYTGDEKTLIDMPDKILELLELEEKGLEDTINNYRFETIATLKNDFDKLDIKLNKYTEELIELHNEIRSTASDIDDTNDNTKKIKDNLRDMLIAGGASTAAAATIAALKDGIKKKTDELAGESPASAWIEKMTDLIIGVVKSPIDMIISIISKIIESIVEFITELPLPSFSLIKEFFTDLLGLGNPSKMQEVISKMILDISGAGEDFLPVVENIVSFLPWLFIEIAKTFITSVVEPLPIPI